MDDLGRFLSFYVYLGLSRSYLVASLDYSLFSFSFLGANLVRMAIYLGYNSSFLCTFLSKPILRGNKFGSSNIFSRES